MKQGRFKSIFPELGTKTKKYTFFKLTHIRILYKNNRKFNFTYTKSRLFLVRTHKNVTIISSLIHIVCLNTTNYLQKEY